MAKKKIYKKKKKKKNIFKINRLGLDNGTIGQFVQDAQTNAAHKRIS